jgi:hypothetical protein
MVDRYRIYFVGSDGLFSGAQLLECADDQEAIQTARQLVDGHDVELWKGERFVARFLHEGQSGKVSIGWQHGGVCEELAPTSGEDFRLISKLLI